MCMLTKFLVSTSLLIAGLSQAGCREPEQRHAISGTVSIGGQPLDEVMIIFTPVGPGLSGAAQVHQGKFECSAKAGPTAGTFNVRLSPSQAELAEVEENINELATRRRTRVPMKYQKLGGLQVEITGEDNQILELKLDR